MTVFIKWQDQILPEIELNDAFNVMSRELSWYYVANAFSLLVATIAPMPSNEQIKVISNYDR